MATPNPDDVEAILLQHFPSMQVLELLAQAVRNSAAVNGHQEPPNGTAGHLGSLAKIAAMRKELQGRPVDEIARRASDARAKRQADLKAQAERDAAKKAAKQEAKERQRFYNQPHAMADFGLWCKADFWLMDDAVSLLLGRDPRIVNAATLAAELAQGQGLFSLGESPPRSSFHAAFEDLRALVQRTDMASRGRAAPAEWLAWAKRSGAVNLSAALEKALPPPLRISAQEAMPPPPIPGLMDDSRDKLPGRTRWTPEALAALRQYKLAHGTKAAAERYDISPARVRQLTPSAEQRPKPDALSKAWHPSSPKRPGSSRR